MNPYLIASAISRTNSPLIAALAILIAALAIKLIAILAMARFSKNLNYLKLLENSQKTPNIEQKIVEIFVCSSDAR
jgi:hypothetical protein